MQKFAGTFAPLFILLFAFLSTTSSAQVAAPILHVRAYIEQVQKGNEAFVSAVLLETSAELRRDEASVLTMPALIASAQYIDDERETGSTLQGSGTSGQNYSLGVRQQTEFGLEGRLLYNFNKFSIEGVNPAFLEEPEYYTSGPVLEVTQPLLRNGFGSETRASKQLIDARVNAQKFDQIYIQKQILADAEAAYWRLALAREAVERTRETLDRAQRLRSWSSRRQNLNLGNRSDLLQSDAAYLSRNLELKFALDEEKAAAREFNTMRGVNSEIVSESLHTFDGNFLVSLSVPERARAREDVLAAEQEKRASEAASRLGAEQNKPILNLVGTVGLNGRDGSGRESIAESTKTDHPNYTIGLRLDMPFDIGALSDIRSGYKKEALAADHRYRRKVFEEEREWQDQVALFTEARERLKLTTDIEKAQRDKMTYERNRQGRGLSTMFQVLQFEQDFANAQLARIRAQAEIINIYSDLKTFGSGR